MNQSEKETAFQKEDVGYTNIRKLKKYKGEHLGSQTNNCRKALLLRGLGNKEVRTVFTSRWGLEVLKEHPTPPPLQLQSWYLDPLPGAQHTKPGGSEGGTSVDAGSE